MADGDLIVENAAPVVPGPVAEASAAVSPSAPADATPSPAPVDAGPKHPAEIPTLLETLKAPAPPEPIKEDVKPEAKPAEPAKVEAKPAETKPEEAKPEAPSEPVEYKFEWSEHVKPEAAKVEAWISLAREVRMPPEAAQKAVGLFNEAANAFVADQQRKQIEVWNNTQEEWKKLALASHVIGGAGHPHAMGAIARVRDELTYRMSKAHASKYEDQKNRVENFLRVTGAGNHPVFLEMMHAVAEFIDEPRAPVGNPNPTKTNGIRPSNSLYANKPQAARQ